MKRLARTFERILSVVRTIPRGRVLTYGEVARRAGFPRGARVAGYAMRASNGTVPWQRVIGQRRAGVGQVSIRDPIGAAVQRGLLEKEGVTFSPSGGIDLKRFGHVGGRLRTPKRRARS